LKGKNILLKGSRSTRMEKLLDVLWIRTNILL
jgi:UDP-N-acetylmuramyl pentapeptide synthase